MSIIPSILREVPKPKDKEETVEQLLSVNFEQRRITWVSEYYETHRNSLSPLEILLKRY